MGLTLGAPLSETKDYGSDLKVQALNFNVVRKTVQIVWGTHDGTEFTGKTMTLTVTKDKSRVVKVDGTSKEFATKFDDAAAQAVVNGTGLDALGTLAKDA